MRKKNMRLVIAGLLFLVLAAGFFILMSNLAPQSTDPAALLRLAGQVSGAVGGISLVLILSGLIGKKAKQ